METASRVPYATPKGQQQHKTCEGARFKPPGMTQRLCSAHYLMGCSETQTQIQEACQEVLKPPVPVLWEFKCHSLQTPFTPGSWWGGKSANSGTRAHVVEMCQVLQRTQCHIHSQDLQSKNTGVTGAEGRYVSKNRTCLKAE